MQLFGFARSFLGGRREEPQKRTEILKAVNECGEDVYIEVESTEPREILRKKCAHLTRFLLSTTANEAAYRTTYDRLILLNRRILIGEENIVALYDEYHTIKSIIKRIHV